jgi:hypothetical protein
LRVRVSAGPTIRVEEQPAKQISEPDKD